MAKKARLTAPTRALVFAARDILRFLDRHNVPACLIGGLAVQRWGEPRATQDVDLTLLAPLGEEEWSIDLLLRRYTGRDASAREFALRRRVLKLAAPNGVPIDVSLGALPFEVEVLDRATRWRLAPTIELVVCSPEDLVIYKLIAGRSRDLLDVEGIVRLQWRKRHRPHSVPRTRIRRPAGVAGHSRPFRGRPPQSPPPFVPLKFTGHRDGRRPVPCHHLHLYRSGRRDELLVATAEVFDNRKVRECAKCPAHQPRLS
jgi:hypothetical protein